MSGWPEGYGRIVVEETTSTLDAARTVPDARPFWFLARHQTAGRGRRGRSWSMPEGNFAATLVLQLNDTPDRLALRSFVMALALSDALSKVTGRPDGISLKWPNDVLLNGGKVAGILLESDGKGHLSIGVGVNLVAAPRASDVEEGAFPPVSVSGETGTSLTTDAFLDVLAECYDCVEHRFSQFGFAPIREAWLGQAARLGEIITARLPNSTVQGRFSGIDETGTLLLQTDKGVQKIAAADIYF